MVDLAVAIEKIEATKLTAQRTHDKEVVYKVSVSIAETEKNPGDVKLSFTLDVTSQPPVARIVISGSATVAGSRQEIQQLLVPGDPKLAPPVLTKIYERVYGTLYILCDALQVTHPLPTLLRE